MTRARLILSLTLSIILIGGAAWMRFSAESTIKVDNLTAVASQSTSETNLDESAQKVAEAISAPLDDASSTPQTDTSLIGKQLFSDFFDLVSNGQATQENIGALAGTYANSISSMDTAKRIGPADLTVVDDSADNFKAYLSALNSIYDKYKELAETQSQSIKDLDTLGPGFVAWAKDMEDIYGREVDELKSMQVPASLLTDHTKLVNDYLSNQSAMLAVQSAETDPARAMGGIVIHEKSLEDEKNILTDIQNIMIKDGIISASQ